LLPVVESRAVASAVKVVTEKPPVPGRSIDAVVPLVVVVPAAAQ
jgi:hypothetical protein